MTALSFSSHQMISFGTPKVHATMSRSGTCMSILMRIKWFNSVAESSISGTRRKTGMWLINYSGPDVFEQLTVGANESKQPSA